MPFMIAQQQLPSANSSTSPSGVADRIAMSFQRSKASDLPAMPETVKSQSIPINGMHRTASEVQLCEEEALADYRDFVVYSRIVNGISRQQQKSHNVYCRQENDKCLAHIVSTRLGSDTLQSMSRHIVQTAAPALVSQDEYFCGEEQSGNIGIDDTKVGDEDEEIFALEL